MPIPAPVLYPPFNIVRLSHTVFNVTDLAASRAFYVDTLGLQVTGEADGRLYLRAMEERGHHSLVLQKADSASVDATVTRSRLHSTLPVGEPPSVVTTTVCTEPSTRLQPLWPLPLVPVPVKPSSRTASCERKGMDLSYGTGTSATA